MRYYVMSIQHNAEADAENRTAPSAHDTMYEAETQFHSILSRDMKTSTLDWGLCMIINSDGGVHRSEKWYKPIEEENIVKEV